MTQKCIIKIGGNAAQQLTPRFLRRLSIGKNSIFKSPLSTAVVIRFLI